MRQRVEEVGWFNVADIDTAANLCRIATETGDQLGLRSARLRDLEVALAELGRDLLRHPGGGWVELRRLYSRIRFDIAGVGVVVSSPAVGLRFDALEHMASRCDAYALPGRGTAVAAEFWPVNVAPAVALAQGLSRPIPGEPGSGDHFCVRTTQDGWTVMVVDGLGHGPLAAVASAEATKAFRGAGSDEPVEIMDEIHQALETTRGAAVAIARLEPQRHRIRFAGIGNIAAAVVTGSDARHSSRSQPTRHGMTSSPGIVGHQYGTVREYAYPLDDESMVVMHSDGLTDRWNLAAYPGLADHDPLVVAATLMRDAGIRHDDACVLVARVSPSASQLLGVT